MIEALLLNKTRYLGVVTVFLGLGLAGCGGPVELYHNVQGGAIDQPRQAPPGADKPFPNLADVPPAPAMLSAAQQADLQARLKPDSAEIPATIANKAALDGLALPVAAPPAPKLPGLAVAAGVAPPVAAAKAPPVPARADGVPVLVAFAPGSAILDADMLVALQKLAASRGDAQVLAGGFGEQEGVPAQSALVLALRRARAIADALTADKVPAASIRLRAGAEGSGGFAQLVY